MKKLSPRRFAAIDFRLSVASGERGRILLLAQYRLDGDWNWRRRRRLGALRRFVSCDRICRACPYAGAPFRPASASYAGAPLRAPCADA